MENRIYFRQAPTDARLWAKRLCITVGVCWAIGLAAGFTSGLLLLTFAGFGFTLLGWKQPLPGALGVGLLVTVDSIARGYVMTGGLLRWNTFNYVLLATMLLFFSRLLKLRDVQSLLLALFAGVLLLGLLITPDLDNATEHILNFTTCFGLIIFFLRVEQCRDFWYWMAITNGFAAGLGGLVFYLRGAPRMNPNAWALFPLCALFSIALGFRSASSRKQEKLLMGLAALNCVWVFLTASRGAMIDAILVCVYLFATIRDVSRRITYFGSCVMMAMFVVALFPDALFNSTHRVDKLLDDKESANARTSGRSDLVLAGWYLFQENPLGVGTGGFAKSFQRLDHTELAFYGHYKQAHAAWIKVLAENGAVGILLFTGWVLSFAWVGWRKRKQGLFRLGLLTTVILAFSFTFTEFQGKTLWLLASATAVQLYPSRRYAVIWQPAKPAAVWEPAVLSTEHAS